MKNQQKKFISKKTILIAAVALLLIAAAVTAACMLTGRGNPQPATYAGKWVLTGAELNGILMGPAAMQNMEMSMTLELRENGTFTEVENDVTNTGAWETAENSVTLTTDESTVTLTDEDGVLVLKEEGGTLMLTREGAQAAVADVAAPELRSKVEIGAFNGSWRVTRVHMMGMIVPAENMGMYMALILEDGIGIYGESDSEGEIGQNPVSYAIREVEGVGTALDVNYITQDDADDVGLTLYMTTDDELYMDVEGVGVFFTNQNGGE